MPHIPARRRALAALITLACLPAARAQPERPLRLIVPLAAGSTVDAVARVLAPGMGRAGGHPVVVENIAGAGGIPGTGQIVRAARDGLTLGMVSSNHVINPGLYKSIPYDSLRDITPIAVVATVPLVLVVHPALPVRSVRELLAHARAHPGQLNYGSAGNGSTLHLAAELLASETGVDIRHVPYRGTGPLMTDLIGGQVQMGFVSISQVTPHLKSGALRALALSTPVRSAALPELPTLAEAGVAKYGFDAWIALVGPGGLPRAQIDAAHAAVRAALAAPEARAALAAQGLMLLDTGPDAAPAFFQSELAKHQKLVRLSGATMD